MKHTIYVVLLAGGKGERLWPLSTQKKPKQLIPIKKNTSLLEETLNRVKSLTNPKNIFITTTQDYKKKIEVYLHKKQVIVEPEGKNTGPALLLSCLELYKKDPSAHVIFFPADHHIGQKKLFLNTIRRALRFSIEHDTLTLIGIKPRHPATGYGYIEFNSATHFITRFHEKPNSQTAKRYCEQENIVWNAGMFCGSLKNFIDAYKAHAPALFESVSAYINNTASYAQIESISVDHAVFEKIERCAVIPADFDWSDVGNLHTFLSIKNAFDKNKSHSISVQSTNNLVWTSHKLVALVGVQDLCIVETNSTLLIANKTEVEEVKQIVNTLKKNNRNKFL